MDNPTSIEVYKIMNERVQKEIDELYDVHRFHMFSVTALITACGLSYQNAWINIVGGIASLFICIIWWLAAKEQEKWKLWWTEQLALVEHELKDVSIWKKVIYIESSDNEELMERLEKPDKLIDRPPSMGSVDSFLRYRPIVLGGISTLAILYGIYGIISGSTLF